MRTRLLIAAQAFIFSGGSSYAQAPEDPILSQYATDYGISQNTAKAQMDA